MFKSRITAAHTVVQIEFNPHRGSYEEAKRQAFAALEEIHHAPIPPTGMGYWRRPVEGSLPNEMTTAHDVFPSLPMQPLISCAS
jgi:hypothetical protein